MAQGVRGLRQEHREAAPSGTLLVGQAIKVKGQIESCQYLVVEGRVEAGIAAEVVGKSLKRLSDSYQTISITHLPQIAKMADHHFSVRKAEQKGRTVTRVVPLGRDDRAEELAKLLGGEKISEVTMRHAREMLEQA